MSLRRRIAELLLVPAAAAALVFVPVRTVRAEDVPVAATARADVHQRDLDAIRAVLQTEAAAARLADAGVTREAVLARVERMTPAEAHYLAERLQQEQMEGGDGLGILVTVLVIILLVVLILVLVDKKVEVKDRGSHLPSGVRDSPAIARGAVLG